MFHPETMTLAQKDRRFKGIVEDTALSMLSKDFGVLLDGKTAKYPKMTYKGKAPPLVIRTKLGSDDRNAACEPLEEYWKKTFESEIDMAKAQTPLPLTIPKYTMKYRDIIDMADFSNLAYTDKCAPKEIVVEISLPNVKKASEVELDVYEKKIAVKSCENVNHRYNLDLVLSYAVKAADGTAKFDRPRSKLTVILPLKDRGIPVLNEETI